MITTMKVEANEFDAADYQVALHQLMAWIVACYVDMDLADTYTGSVVTLKCETASLLVARIHAEIQPPLGLGISFEVIVAFYVDDVVATMLSSGVPAEIRNAFEHAL